MKRTASVEGWSVTLRVRTYRKKRRVNGKVRGRYEVKTVTIDVLAPNGKRREYYLGAGGEHKKNAGVSTSPGEEKAPRARAGELLEHGGRTGGRKQGITDGDTRDLANGKPDPRQGALGDWVRGLSSERSSMGRGSRSR